MHLIRRNRFDLHAPDRNPLPGVAGRKKTFKKSQVFFQLAVFGFEQFDLFTELRLRCFFDDQLVVGGIHRAGAA